MKPIKVTEERIRKERAHKKAMKKHHILNKYSRMQNKRLEVLKRKQESEIERMERRYSQMEERDVKNLLKPITNKPRILLFEKAQENKKRKGIAHDIVQLYARLRDTDKYGKGPCISCDPKKIYVWEQLEGGHCFPKGKTLAISCDYRNVNSQCSHCNSPKIGLGGNYAVQKPRVEQKRGEGTLADLEQKAMAKKKVDYKQVVIDTLPLAWALLKEKKFTSTYYKDKCKSLAKKLGIALL